MGEDLQAGEKQAMGEVKDGREEEERRDSVFLNGWRKRQWK